MIRTDNQPRYYPVKLGSEAQPKGTDSPTAIGVTVDSFGLRLSPAELKGPLALDSHDGSVGRIVLPQGFAVDAKGRCYFAERATGVIWFFDPLGPRVTDRPFRRILNFPTSTPSDEPRPLWSLAANSESLFIIRPDHRGLVSVALDHWAVQDIRCFGDHEQARDVATFHNTVYALTDSTVYFRRSPALTWKLFAKLPSPHNHDKKRLLIGKTGGVFVQLNRHDASHPNEHGVYSVADRSWTISPDRTLFPVPAVVTHPAADGNSRFQYIVSASAASPGCAVRDPLCDEACDPPCGAVCESPPDLFAPGACVPPELAAPEISREMLDSDDLLSGFVMREDGTRMRTRQFKPSTQRLFLTGDEVHVIGNKRQVGSVWLSQAIDSHRYHCRWDRIELQLRIPAGCRVIFSTMTLDDDPAPDATNAPAELLPKMLESPESNWTLGASFEASAPRLKAGRCEDLDFLIRSKPGRYLFLRVQLFGDGFSTPVVRNILAKGPRQSHVDFLPAVMREDDVSRDFLERFVSVFQTEWDRLETSVDEMIRLFNPAAIDELQLERLAGWFGIPLPAGWDNTQYRGFLKFAPDLLMAPADEQRGRIGGSRRGTVEHIRNAVRAVLGGLTGLNESQMQGFPQIIEGFRERNQLSVGSDNVLCETTDGDRLAPPVGRTLWGPDSVGRLQLGDNSVLGERKLLPAARQELDLYATYAHRIRVVVPACWVKRPEDLCVLEAMIESEKPAHVACEISLVRAGMRLGAQSTIGVDTIFGDWPAAVLAASPAPTLGLGQGLVLPDSNERPPPMPVEGPLGTHTL